VAVAIFEKVSMLFAAGFAMADPSAVPHLDLTDLDTSSVLAMVCALISAERKDSPLNLPTLQPPATYYCRWL
jgi:hypothetical protein